MTLDKLIESVEGFNGIEITDDTLVIRDLDFSVNLAEIKDFRIQDSPNTKGIWLKTKKAKVDYFYNDCNTRWRVSHLNITEIC